MRRPEPDSASLKARFAPRLEAELADLQRLSEATAADRDPVALDQQSVGRLSRMDAIQAQAMAQATDRRRQQRKAQIRAALQRMEEGEFGYCTACGEAIGSKRLDVDPAAPLCLACAGKATP